MIKEGIINVYKPQNYTSHDCVNVIRSLTGVKRVGHTGTLDPMATGVLPICIGSAARITEYLDLDFKGYSCTMKLGLSTDTLDIWGEVQEDKCQEARLLIESGSINRESIEKALEQFRGTIEQIPPKYSALKVEGRKLYEYARAGKEVEIKARKVYIEDIKLVDTDLENLQFSFQIVCSKGTYIRSICRDIGEILGAPGCMTGLERTFSGVFKVENAVSIEELKALKQGEDERNPETGRIVKYARAREEDINLYIGHIHPALSHFGRAVITPEVGEVFCNGGFLYPPDVKVEEEPEYKEKDAHIEVRPEFRLAYNFFDSTGRFLGVGFFREVEGKYKADKVFSRPIYG